MASFGWAYVDCASGAGDGGSGSSGPAYSLQFLTASGGGHTTGSAYLTYYTSSVHAPDSDGHTLHLTGTLKVNGAISASSYHIENITQIGATGSTFFGNSADDVHIRTGSLTVTKPVWGPANYILSASTHDESVRVRGFGGNYEQVLGATSYTVKSADYIIGVAEPNTVRVTLPGPSGSNAGRLIIIKDEYLGRGTGSIIVTGSLDSSYIDHDVSYTMTGSLPAINLYSNGSNWFVF
jgi:hypothetical protein